MGRRQIGELSTHEFVITILISSVATIPLQDTEIPLANSLIPILILISLEIIQSSLSLKSKKFSGLFEGKPIFIIKNGKLKQNELSRLRLKMSDIIDSLRAERIFNISEVKNAIIETDGKISVQKREDKVPFSTPVVTDGKKDTEYFGKDKIDDKKIEKLIKKTGLKESEIMLLTLDENGDIYFIKKDKGGK